MSVSATRKDVEFGRLCEREQTIGVVHKHASMFSDYVKFRLEVYLRARATAFLTIVILIYSGCSGRMVGLNPGLMPSKVESRQSIRGESVFSKNGSNLLQTECKQSNEWPRFRRDSSRDGSTPPLNF